MSLNEDKLKRAIKLIEECKQDFEPKDVHHNWRYVSYCVRYLDKSKNCLTGVLYYMDK